VSYTVRSMETRSARGVGAGSNRAASTADVLRELDSVHRTMNGVKDRLDQLEKNTNARFDAVDERFDAVDKRLDGVTADIAEIKALIIALPKVAFQSGELDFTGGVETTPPRPDD